MPSAIEAISRPRKELRSIPAIRIGAGAEDPIGTPVWKVMSNRAGKARGGRLSRILVADKVPTVEDNCQCGRGDDAVMVELGARGWRVNRVAEHELRTRARLATILEWLSGAVEAGPTAPRIGGLIQ